MRALVKAFEGFCICIALVFLVMQVAAWICGTKVAIVPREFDVEKAVVEWELQREGNGPL